MRARMRRPGLHLLALMLIVGCTTGGPLEVTRAVTEVPELPTDRPSHDGPRGAVRVAYPGEPIGFLLPPGEHPATDDLAALWGLPLVRLDGHGQVRRALVRDWSVSSTNGWHVDLALAAGAWTDGTPVTAQDVVATIERRMEEDQVRFAGLTSVSAVADARVRLDFDAPVGAVGDLLVDVGPVLPAAVDADDYRDAIPVSGGWFRLADHQPGLSFRFVAHPDGPLGPPRLQEIEVVVVPNDETALGLLDEGVVDAVVGHLSINPVSRAVELDGVEAAAPIGGTQVGLEFRGDGPQGGPDAADRRRALAEAIQVHDLVEGLLGPYGEIAQTFWPGVELERAPEPGELRQGVEISLLYPREVGVAGFTARIIQRDLQARGVQVQVVAEVDPRLHEDALSEHDVVLRVRRTTHRPSLAAWVEDPALAEAAARGDTLGDGVVVDALAAVAQHALYVPLYRVGVLHAWRDVEGVRPSAWPGLGLWNAGEWHVDR